MRHTTRLRRVTVALLVTALVACGAPGAPRGELDAADLDLLHDAEQRLTVDCMRAAGFEYRPYERVGHGPSFPYVVDDVGWAQEHGYGRDLETAADAEVGATPNERYFASLADDQRAAALTALNGDPSRDDESSRLTAHLPSGGTVHRSARSCTSSAQRVLYGDLPRWFEVTRITADLVSVRQAMVHADPRFTAAVEVWSGCMHAAGFPVASPGEARDSLPPFSPDNSGGVEIATATAEALCATSTPLAQLADELDAHFRQVLRDRHHAEFADLVRLRGAALSRARDVLDLS